MDRREDAGEFYPGGKVVQTRPVVPAIAPVEPSTDPSAAGKPADAKATGDALAAKYQKPGTGIPKSDMDASVQTSLGLADTALQFAPVSSVNGKTGAVTLGAEDVGALPLTGGEMTGNLSVVGYSPNPYNPYQYRIELDAGGQRINLYRGDTRVSSLIIPYTPYGTDVLALDSDIERVEGKLRYAIMRPWDGLDAPGTNVVALLIVTSSTAILQAVNPVVQDGVKIYDFYADVVNEYSANAEIELGGLGSVWEAVVRDGESLSQMTTLAPGEMARFHFTETAFDLHKDRPVFLVTKTVLIIPESGGATYQLETDGTVSTEGELNSDGTFTVEAL